MNRRKSSKRGLIILAFLFLLLNVPFQQVQELRSMAVASLAPIQALAWMPHFIFKFSSDSGLENKEKLLRLENENQLLKHELSRWKDLFQHELHLLAELSSVSQSSKTLEPAVERHRRNSLKLTAFKLKGTLAEVIFRSPLSWNHSLWINLGESNNPTGEPIKIGKNSPVLAGQAVVGVVDYVGSHQSRVRLISDPGLSLSVRSARGDPQAKLMTEQLQMLIGMLSIRNEFFGSKAEKQEALGQLNRIKERLESVSPTCDLLAKGELQGSSKTSWRQPSQFLEGVGFNYEFDDAEGPARDLRTGKPMDGSKVSEQTPLLKVHDLLLTTGLDGVFPAGLPVAEVTRIHMLKEGDYAYQLEAKPIAGDLQSLSLLQVLPPRGYDTEDQPKGF